MKRDWGPFIKMTVKSLRNTAVSMILVPLFFLMINPHISQPGYWKDFGISVRVGAQISLFFLFSNTVFFGLLYRRDPDSVWRIKKSLPLQVIKGLAVMLAGLGLSALLEPHISGETFGIEGVTIGLLVGGITFMLILFFTAYRRTQEHNLILRTQSAENSLNVLKNQMQPHFLFNSLNSLSELIELDQEGASQMTQRLADLYRQILESSQKPLATLKSEISILNHYLNIEKIRFGDRLDFRLEYPSQSEEVYIPSLLLQTLVENCVKHGVARSRKGGQIHVEIRPAETGYRVQIKNSGATLVASERKEERKSGLSISKERLNLLYGERSNFQLRSDPTDGETTVSFWFSGAAHA
jgi:signal transduction histidine kinase